MESLTPTIKLLIILIIYALSSISIAYADTLNDIKTYCANEWGTDYSMQKYCINKERNAFVEVMEYLEKHKEKIITQNETVFNPYAQIADKCTSEWTQGDFIQWSMVNYCINKQTSAYEELQQ